ncbi:MAG TPA: DUF6171 family protein [Methylomirabilota bacterium]|nr:DUF6171 family protein [Methylomirabilota bacterium]
MKFPIGRQVVSIGGQRKMPGPVALAKNAAGAVVRSAAAVASGNPLKADDAEIERRKGVCENCEAYVAESGRCGHAACGCFLRAKTWLRAERCPAEKW